MAYGKVRGHRVWWLKKNGKSIGEFDINGITSDEEAEKNVDDIVKLDADNKALREELDKEREALNSAQKVMDVYEKQKRALREELDALKQSIPKIKADAIRLYGEHVSYCRNVTLESPMTPEEYANKVENGS